MIDFCRSTDAVLLENDIDHILQQIDVLFSTNPGEVMGYTRFGTNYSDFLYNLNVGGDTISSIVYDDITSNCNLFGWTLSVDTQFALGTENDIIFISITLSNNGENYSKIYRISEYEESYIEDEYLT